VGAEVVVEAELTEVNGRRLMFSFIARESAHRPGGDGEGARRAGGAGEGARRAGGAGGEARSAGEDGEGARSVGGAGGDGEDLVVGAGTVERVLVDRAAFLARAAGPRP
jgi:predicted thioesterase